MAYAEKRGKYWRGRYQLPDGSWGSVTRDDAGQRFESKTVCKAYAAGLETDVHRKTFINPRDGRITVADWSKLWLESIEVDERSDDTYRQRLRTVILPHWAETPVADITTVAVNTWEKKLRARYAPAYVKSIMSVFRIMLEDAVASKVRADNPVPERRQQRRGKYKGHKREDTTVLATPRQALLVARNAREMHGLNAYVMVLTIAYAALRISELAGLRREHLHLEDTGRGARLEVTEQHRYRAGAASQAPPKYGSSGSLILPPFLAELLAQQLDSHGSDWVFTAPKGGKLYTSASFYKQLWRPWVDGREQAVDRLGRKGRLPAVQAVAGVENLVPHGLRHSHKVWLDEGKHPRVAVEERMRHVLPGVEGTYSHTTLPMELDIAAYLQRLWVESTAAEDDDGEWEPPRAPRTPPS